MNRILVLVFLHLSSVSSISTAQEESRRNGPLYWLIRWQADTFYCSTITASRECNTLLYAVFRRRRGGWVAASQDELNLFELHLSIHPAKSVKSQSKNHIAGLSRQVISVRIVCFCCCCILLTENVLHSHQGGCLLRRIRVAPSYSL